MNHRSLWSSRVETNAHVALLQAELRKRGVRFTYGIPLPKKYLAQIYFRPERIAVEVAEARDEERVAFLATRNVLQLYVTPASVQAAVAVVAVKIVRELRKRGVVADPARSKPESLVPSVP